MASEEKPSVLLTQGSLASYTTTELGCIRFVDKRPMLYSSKCQPRDIVLLQSEQLNEHEQRQLREDICVDVRRAQGVPESGIRRNLLW